MASGAPPETKSTKKSRKASGAAVDQPPVLTKESMIRMLMQTSSPSPSVQSSPTGKKTMGPPTSLPKWSSSSIVPPLNLSHNVMSPKFTVQVPQQSSGMLRPEFFLEDQPLPFIHLISEKERDVGMVQLDHAYSKPWNWKSDVSTFSKPAKTLFIRRFSRSNRQGANTTVLKEIVDIESISPPQSPPYDVQKASKVMDECENFSDFANPFVGEIDSDSDWEEAINKEGWLPRQTRLFNKVCKILHEDQLARIVHSEPIRRRISVDSTAKKLRHAFSSSNWDIKTLQWLHIVLTENLTRSYLSGYIDAMQKLRRKVPSLIDKILNVKQPIDPLSCTAYDGMKLLMKRPWNPAYTTLNNHKLRRLPGNPIIVLTPSGPSDAWCMTSIRLRHWRSMLSNLGRLVVVSMPSVEKSPGGTTWTLPSRHSSASGTCLSPPMSPKSETDDPNGPNNFVSLQQDGTKVGAYLQRMILSIYTKVKELRQANPDRPVILVGWGAAAAINCHVASMDSNAPAGLNGGSNSGVTACICLGFPMHTLDGCRGDPDDPILEMRTPVLFVVGENARQCRSDDVEDMRRRMKVTNSLVVVGGADDVLRLSSMKKRTEGVTQTMVDRCVLDEIREFLCSVISQPPPLPVPSVINSITALTPSSKDNVDGVTKKTGSGRPRKKNTDPSERKTKKRKKMDETSGESNSSSANTTPGVTSKPPSKRKRQTSDGDLSKARKMLELNTLPSNTALNGAQIASINSSLTSPLLSSALTSKPSMNLQGKSFGAPGFGGIQQPVPGVLGIRSPSTPKMDGTFINQPPRPSPIIQGGKIFHQPLSLGGQGLNLSIPQSLGVPGVGFPSTGSGISIAGSTQSSNPQMSLGLQLSPVAGSQTSLALSPPTHNIATQQQSILQFSPLQLNINHSPTKINLPNSPLPLKPSHTPQQFNSGHQPCSELTQFSSIAHPSSSSTSIASNASSIIQKHQSTPFNQEAGPSSMIPTSLTPRLPGSLTITQSGTTGTPVLLTPRVQSHSIQGSAMSTPTAVSAVKQPSPVQSMVTLTNRGSTIQISLVPPQTKSAQVSPVQQPESCNNQVAPREPEPEVSSDLISISNPSMFTSKPTSRDPNTTAGPSSSTSSQSSTPSSANSQTELRNVAEILASLSGGFLQNPSAIVSKKSDQESNKSSSQTELNCTNSQVADDSTESSQSKLTTNIKGSSPSQRLIRVLQSSTTVNSESPTTSQMQVAAPRIRKQMLTSTLVNTALPDQPEVPLSRNPQDIEDTEKKKLQSQKRRSTRK